MGNNDTPKNQAAKTILAIAVLIAALSAGYYYVIFLPNRQTPAEIQEAQLKQFELDQKKNEVAQKLRDDCAKKAEQVRSTFDIESTYASPFFYPYNDASSFNKNDDLLTAISAFKSCIETDPRYDSNNEPVLRMVDNAQTAMNTIRNHMKSVIGGEITCTDYRLTVSAKDTCEDLLKEKN